MRCKRFFKQHKLPKRGVRLGIANNRIGVRTFELTGIDDPKQLANAIRFRAQEVLPIPLEEAVLDYQVLDRVGRTRKASRSRRVLLVVAYRELVDRYVYACRKAGLQLVGIDLEAFALLRAVAEPHDPLPGQARRARRGLASATTARPSPSPTVASASSLACSSGAAGRSTSPSRARSTLRRARPSRSSGRSRSPGRRRRPTASRGAARDGTRGRQAAAADVRAGARLLAPVLPEPARLARHRRDRPHGRHRAPAGPRRRARAAHRRAGPGGRSAHSRQVSKKVGEPSSSARSQSRSASGSRTDARRQPSPARRPPRELRGQARSSFGVAGGVAATAIPRPR